MVKNRILITDVLDNSIAKEAGVEKGDVLLKVNGEKIIDIFDYNYLINDEYIELDILRPNGERLIFEIEKDIDEDPGIVFERPLIDNEKRCRNNCIFCFIDQLPDKMRKTLYFKDDDFRLSFLTGNYVTLTNTSKEDIKRIIKYHMSPINISVHTTNPILRSSMLGNRKAPEILEQIKSLSDGGISINTQIVLCRGLNDGDELDRTIKDLSMFFPGIISICIVPVGLTRFRENREKLTPYDKESALEVIKKVKGFQNEFLEKYGSRILFLADEFYLTAGVDLPDYEEYEDFSQLENGVGMMRIFIRDFNIALSGMDPTKIAEHPKSAAVVTGKLAFENIKRLCSLAEVKTGIKIDVYPVRNDFFGENVTVTGLLTGTDIICQLKEKAVPEILMICRSMLRSGEDVFLDDLTVKDIENELNTRIIIIPNDGRAFALTILKLQSIVN